MSALLAVANAVAHLFGAKDTTRSATAEYGLPVSARYGRELSAYSDEYLTLAERDEVIARAQADAAARNARKVGTR
jgi:hypothetical protein